MARSLAMICLSRAILRLRASPDRAGTPLCTARLCWAHCFSRAAREVQSPAWAAADIFAVNPASCSYIVTTSFEVILAPPCVESDYRMSFHNGVSGGNFRVPRQINSFFFQFVTNTARWIAIPSIPRFVRPGAVLRRSSHPRPLAPPRLYSAGWRKKHPETYEPVRISARGTDGRRPRAGLAGARRPRRSTVQFRRHPRQTAQGRGARPVRRPPHAQPQGQHLSRRGDGRDRRAGTHFADRAQRLSTGDRQRHLVRQADRRTQADARVEW